MGGSGAHEFMVLNEHGEDTLVLCDACGYAANQQVARVRRPEPAAEEPLPTEEVATPGTDTIASLAALLGVPTARTAKAAFFVTGDGRLITAIVRGDFEVNETKLANAVQAVRGLRPATAEEIRAAGMEPGYGSPIGAHDTVVVVDDLVARARRTWWPARTGPASTCATSTPAATSRPTWWPTSPTRARATRARTAARRCGWRTGIEVGNIFKLGTDFTEALGATFLAEDGSRRPRRDGLATGSASGRALACIVEAHHDEKGIAWPVEVAPYRAHLVAIGADATIRPWRRRPTALYQRLIDAGVAVLYDDRDESPGVKFTDAELLGMPTIVTISPTLAGGRRRRGHRSRVRRAWCGRCRSKPLGRRADVMTRPDRATRSSPTLRRAHGHLPGPPRRMHRPSARTSSIGCRSSTSPTCASLRRRGVLIANGPLGEQTDERMRGISIFVCRSPRRSSWPTPIRWSGPAGWRDEGRPLVDRGRDGEVRDRLDSAQLREDLGADALEPRGVGHAAHAEDDVLAPASPSSPKRSTIASVESLSRSTLVRTVRSISS